MLVVAEEVGNTWRLLYPLTYEGNFDTFEVPKDFRTDFASVPRIFWNIIPPTGGYTKAAVLHDYLYYTKMVSRKDADGIFRRIMHEYGVGGLKRRTMYWAVRAFGWLAWKK
jgi:hypothetical protein